MVADQCKDAHIITVPQGEASKSFKILESVLKQMLEFGMGRGDLVIAVGGGVVGDLAGFAASIYMRGIDFINCPTKEDVPGGTGETAEKMIKTWKQTLAAVQVDCEIPISAAVGYAIGEHEKLKNVIAEADNILHR